MARSRARDELALAYLLAGSEARRDALRPEARSLLARTDFEWLAGALADRRLLPLIGSRAIEAGGEIVPESFRTTVQAARAATRAHGLAVESATRRVVGLLAEAGIRALRLKGPQLAEEAHGDIGLRATHDIDVLVAAADLQPAARALQAAGFSEPVGRLGREGLPDLHLELHHDALPRVELHWRVHWDERAFSSQMLARATEGADGMLRAQPDDLAASLLLFYARDGFHGVRMAADIAAWWDRHGAALPPRLLEEHARRHPELQPSLTAAATAAQRLTGVPALLWLGTEVARSRRVDVAARLADWSQEGDRDQLAANIVFAGALLGPRGSGARFARRELSLPGAGPAASAAHAAKLCARFAFALWRLRGGRNWIDLPSAAGAGS